MQASENWSPVSTSSTPLPNHGASAVRIACALKPGAVGEASAARAAVAEMHRDALVRMPDDREHRAADDAAAVPELDDVADDLAVLAALK